MRRGCLAALLLSGSSLACGPDESECFSGSQDVQPDARIRGVVVRDLLDSYFGRYEGTLTWLDGTTTPFELDLRYERGAPFTIHDTYACQARTVGYWSPARITTGDGTFDNEITVSVTAVFPYASPSLGPDSVANFSVLPDWEWSAGVRPRLPVDPSRYNSPGLLFVLEWPARDPAPTSGALNFYGSLATAPELYDTLQVASLEF